VLTYFFNPHKKLNMKRILILWMNLFILCLFNFSSHAQTIVNRNWLKTGGIPNGIYDFQASHVDNAGKIVTCGNTLHYGQSENFLIVKRKSDGTLIFQKEYDGTASNTDFATDVTTLGSDTYVTGVEGDTVAGTSSITTMKLDSLGNIVWVQQYHNAYNKYNLGFRIIPDATGSNIYVCGTSQTGATDFGMTLLKYKTIGGSPSWVATYDSIGLYDAATDMKISGGSIIVYGVSGLSSTSGDIITRSYNTSTGALLSQSRINNANAYVTRPVAIAKDKRENIYLCGVSNDAGRMDDLVLIMLDSSLTLKWRKYIDGGNLKNDGVSAIKIDSKDNIILTGWAANADSSKAMYTIRMKDSVIIWNKKRLCSIAGQDAKSFDVDLDASDNIYITGKIYNGTNYDQITISYDTSGVTRWEQQYALSLTSDDEGRNVKIDSGGNVYVYGRNSTNGGAYTYSTMRYIQDKTYFPSDTLPPIPQWAYYENKGQITDSGAHQAAYVHYYTNTANPRVYLTDNFLSYVYDRRDTIKDTLQRIDMVFRQSDIKDSKPVNSAPNLFASEQIDPYLNYCIGGLPQFYEGVRGSQRITAKNLYPNIDWQIYSDAGGPKYYYVVQPGGNPTDIVFQYQGATNTYADSTGITITGLFDTTRSVVRAFQGTTPVSVSVGSLGSNKYYFTLGSYNHSLPLTIMVSQRPRAAAARSSDNLQWCTYWGASTNDEAEVINSTYGYKLVAGLTNSYDFPITSGLISNANSNEGSFLTKFNRGDSVVWSTYYGSIQYVYGHHFTTALTSSYPINRAGNFTDQQAYIAGSTAKQNLPIVNEGGGAYIDSTYNGGIRDIYLAIFNVNTGILLHSTYLGSDSDDEVSNLTSDASTLNVFLTGSTTGTNFPRINTFAGSGNFFDTVGRGVIAEFDGNANLLLSTGFGSSQVDVTDNPTFISDAKIDKDGSLIITGSTPFAFSYSGITLPSGAYSQSYTNGALSQAFIAKFKKASGSTNRFSLYYYSLFGGADATYGDKICFNTYNDMYVVGHSGCSGFPIYPSGTCGGGGSMFVSRFNTDGVRKYANIKPNSLIMGQSNNLYSNGITVTGSGQSKREGDILCDARNNLFVYGLAKRTGGSVSLQPHSGYFYDSIYAQSEVILEYDSNLNLVWGTFFGGSFVQYAGGMTLDNAEHLYICGSTSSPSTDVNGNSIFPIKFEPGATNVSVYNNARNLGANWEDAFIAKFYIGTNITTETHEIEGVHSLLKCYPNPSNGEFSLNLSSFDDGAKEIKIYDQLGRLVFSAISDQQIATVKIEHVSQGMYIVNVSNGAKSDAAKIIITNPR
jgi:hypothetical protein